MNRIHVKDLKKGMKLFEQQSMVTDDDGHLSVLTDAVKEGNSYSADVVRFEDDAQYVVGQGEGDNPYGPFLYLLSE